MTQFVLGRTLTTRKSLRVSVVVVLMSLGPAFTGIVPINKSRDVSEVQVGSRDTRDENGSLRVQRYLYRPPIHNIDRASV